MTTAEQTQNAEAITDPNLKTVQFDFGFKRGETMITEVIIRKPKTHALRGLSLVNLLNLDIDSIAKVASRVTEPAMSQNDVYELDPVDLTKLGVALIDFFVSTKDGSQNL